MFQETQKTELDFSKFWKSGVFHCTIEMICGLVSLVKYQFIICVHEKKAEKSVS